MIWRTSIIFSRWGEREAENKGGREGREIRTGLVYNVDSNLRPLLGFEDFAKQNMKYKYVCCGESTWVQSSQLVNSLGLRFRARAMS